MENGFVVQKTLASGSQSAILAHWWNGQCNARRKWWNKRCNARLTWGRAVQCTAHPFLERHRKWWNKQAVQEWPLWCAPLRDSSEVRMWAV